MITYAAIKSDIAASLDSEGNDAFIDQLDYVPAINKAQDYLMSIILPKLGSKKFNEEVLKGLIQTRIFQPSIYSRIYVDQVISTWGLISIMVNPVVAIPPAPSTPFTPVAVGSPDESAMLTNMIYVSGGSGCRRLNSQEWVSNQNNPLLDSYVPSESNPVNLNYGYITHIDNLSTIDPVMPYEITIRPFINNITPVAITYAKYPTRVTFPALNNLDWNPIFQQLLVKASLKFMMEKVGDETTIYNITEKDIETIIMNQS